MATKNFVPRATGEGQLGTDTKQWNKQIALTGSFGQVSASAQGSFGSLFVGGDSTLAGNLSLNGNITIGDADTDSLVITADLSSSLIPDADSTYNIGSTTKNWKYGYIEEFASTNITASNNISASGNLFLSGNADIDGTSNFADTVTIQTGLFAQTNITASGNISASGTVFASKFESAGASGETISFNDNLNITGNITASNNISASGDIRADGRIFEQGTSVIDHATAMAVVFGG